MKQHMIISFRKQPRPGGIVNLRNVTVRERILRLLLGAPQKLTIVVPGNSVECVAINEVAEGGEL